jgi:hypothetical protein
MLVALFITIEISLAKDTEIGKRGFTFAMHGGTGAVC